MTAAFQSRPNFNTKETNMPNDNIFSGLKVVDFASFIAGPSAAVILSDFGADVIKVEPPGGELGGTGQRFRPHRFSKKPNPGHLPTGTKPARPFVLKSPSAKQILGKPVNWP